MPNQGSLFLQRLKLAEKCGNSGWEGLETLREISYNHDMQFLRHIFYRNQWKKKGSYHYYGSDYSKRIIQASGSVYGSGNNHRRLGSQPERFKSFGFIVISDGTYFEPLQAVYHDTLENFQQVSRLSVGTAVIVKGTLVATPQAKQPFEIQATEVTVEGASRTGLPAAEETPLL